MNSQKSTYQDFVAHARTQTIDYQIVNLFLFFYFFNKLKSKPILKCKSRWNFFQANFL